MERIMKYQWKLTLGQLACASKNLPTEYELRMIFTTTTALLTLPPSNKNWYVLGRKS